MNMYTLREEVYVLFYYICFGIYLFSSMDMINFIYKSIKSKVFKILITLVYWMIQIYVTFLFSYHLLDGYLPIYFFLLIMIGYVLYVKVFKKHFIRTLHILGIIFKKIAKILKKIIKPFLYSKHVITTLKKFMHHYLKIIKQVFGRKEKGLILDEDDHTIEENDKKLS